MSLDESRPAPATPRTWPERGGAWLSASLATGYVLVLAFVLASFPVRNADFWHHLALGRFIDEGHYRFGTDPLAYTTEGVYWANHSWLFDWLLYRAYTALGDGVVLLKALLVTAGTAVVLQASRRGSGVTIPVLVTGLALLAMTPRMLLHPALVSAGLLAVTMLLLRSSLRGTVWGLPLVMAVWVNLDGWFLLGPIAVALTWMGERWGTPSGERRISTGLLVATLAGCLLSPHHVRAFVLPFELSPTVLAGPFRDDPRLGRLFEAAWNWRRYTDPTEGLNGGGIAFLVLLVLGLVSFGLPRVARKGPRLLLWIAFTLLAVVNVRLIPFWAVVAGPVTAWNLQDYLAGRARRPEATVEWRYLLGTALAGLLAVGLLGLCWVGWIQSPGSEARKVGWQVQPDPGLRQAAECRARWRQEGWLTPADRAFHVHPESAAYAAWFAPGERCFVDHRLGLFTHVATEYQAICRAVGVIGEPDREFPAGAGEVLQRFDVTYLVLHDPEPTRLETGFARLDHSLADAPLLVISGREATFGLMRPRQGRPFAEWFLDANTAAFARAEVGGRLPVAPAEGPRREPRRTPQTLRNRIQTTWEDPFQPAVPRHPGTETAALYLRTFQDEVWYRREAARFAPSFLLATLMGTASVPLGGTASVTVGPLLGFGEEGLFPPGQASPSSAFLAVRAARAAVAAEPDNPVAYYRLGQAYAAVSYSTAEYTWATDFRLLAQLRHVQTVFALERALVLEPDLIEAHALLARVYSDRGMFDAALTHLRKQKEIAERRLGRDHAADLAALEADVTALEIAVRERRNEFLIRAPGLTVNPVGRARTALGLGLTQTALDEVLLASDVIQFGTEGARLELELLLMLGRTARLHAELDSSELREGQHRLGWVELAGPRRAGFPPVYRLPAADWFHFLTAAGDGDYDVAESALLRMEERLADTSAGRTRSATRAAAALTTIGVGLAARSETWPAALVTAMDRARMLQLLATERADSQVRADLRALAGLLAIERGEAERAETHLRRALQLGTGDLHSPGEFIAEPLCRSYLWRISRANWRK